MSANAQAIAIFALVILGLILVKKRQEDQQRKPWHLLSDGASSDYGRCC